MPRLNHSSIANAEPCRAGITPRHPDEAITVNRYISEMMAELRWGQVDLLPGMSVKTEQPLLGQQPQPAIGSLRDVCIFASIQKLVLHQSESSCSSRTIADKNALFRDGPHSVARIHEHTGSTWKRK